MAESPAATACLVGHSAVPRLAHAEPSSARARDAAAAVPPRQIARASSLVHESQCDRIHKVARNLGRLRLRGIEERSSVDDEFWRWNRRARLRHREAATVVACSRTAMLLARCRRSLLAAGDRRKKRGHRGTVNAEASAAASEGVAPAREPREGAALAPPRVKDGEGGVESMTRGPHMSLRWRLTPVWRGQNRSTWDKTASPATRC